MEFIKVQRQLEGAKLSRITGLRNSPFLNSSIKWGKHIVENHGFMALFRGYSPHLLRDMVGTSIFFTLYESIKFSLLPLIPNATYAPLVHTLGGGIAGTAIWVVILPIDAAKSVLQREALENTPKYRRAIDFIKHRYKSSGIGGLYRGLKPQLIRSFPVHAVNFLVYEQMLKIL
jgi:solute carrier family 25 carnitine/acylcarnitine transporter 20/29